MYQSENATDYQYIKVPVNDTEKAIETKTSPKYGYGIRHIQLVIFFWCMSISFVARAHLGVTLVAMTSKEHVRVHDINTTWNNYTDNCNITNVDNEIEEELTIYKIYDWPKPIQEMILSAFFLGYFIMMFPIGFVCQRWGGKIPLQVSMLINGVVSILIPWLTQWGGWKAVCACRVIQGLSQAGTFPGIQTLLAQWVPESERATWSNFVYSGTTAGNVVAFQIGGLLAAYGGWPVTFWTVGVICLLTFAVLTVFGESNPAEHKTISDEERQFILGSRSSASGKIRIPWKAILTSKPTWGVIFTQVSSGTAFVFFLNQVPSYIHYVLGINVKSSGLLTSLPYVVSFVISLSFGVISDYVTNRNIVRITNARRISNTISQVGVACSLICASYASSTTMAVACLVLTMSCQMAAHTGWMVNVIDLAPNFSGTLMSIGNTLTNVFILLMPVLVSNIVIDMKNLYQWRIMIYLIAGFTVVCNFVFVFLVSTDVQPWNDAVLTDSEIKSLKRETDTEQVNEANSKETT